MNLKRIQATFILAILLITGHLVAYSKVASAKLTDVNKRSDLITMGSVPGITSVNGYRAATQRNT
jgi:hypothetical protein